MPTMLSKNLPLSTNFTMDEEAKASEQGIVSILGSDCQNNKKTASLRRTLSAASSMELLGSIVDSSSSFSSDDEEDCEEEPKPKTQQDSAPKPCDFLNWGSLLTEKSKEGSESSCPAPYVHPLMKRCSSTLSEKSLEICTESLGSETGSDGFSSSEDGDAEDQQDRSMIVRKSSNLSSKKPSCPRSFPPPLPLLSKENGTSVSMRARRDNGRLVVDAVSVPSKNNFQAQREGGRLILTLVNHEEAEEKTNEEPNVLDEACDEKVVEFEATKIINVQKLALLMNKSIKLANRNPAWPNKKFNEAAKEEQWPSSVPLQAAVGTNVYEYCWRTKSTNSVSQTTNSVSQPPSSLKSYTNNCFIPMKLVSNEIQDPKAMWNGTTKGFNLNPLVKTCNEPRKSLIFWGQSCIATS